MEEIECRYFWEEGERIKNFYQETMDRVKKQFQEQNEIVENIIWNTPLPRKFSGFLNEHS